MKSKNNNKALLFTNNGTSFPVITNLFGSEKRFSSLFGLNSFEEIASLITSYINLLKDKPQSLTEKIKKLLQLKKASSYFPKSVKQNKVPSQEVVIKDIDLSILPILKTWKHDGGKFITLPMVITLDAETANRNVGMYRLQVIDNKTVAMHWHKHKTGAKHFQKYKQLNKKMPIAIALGGDPILTYTATVPLPDDIDEFLFAGLLRKKTVKLVKAKTQNIEVPIEADIILEGYIDPSEDFIIEGPFGDHTGFYSLADYYPKVHITCITHRKNAVYPATVVGIPPQEDYYLIKATERIFLKIMQKSILHEIIDMRMPMEGVAHNLVYIKIQSQFEGNAQKIINALWGLGQMMLNKILIIFSENVDIQNDEKIIDELLNNIEIKKDIFITNGALDVLDHSSNDFAFGNKMAIDATNKREKNKTKFNFDAQILKKYEKITNFNSKFIEKNVLLFNVKKDEDYNKKELLIFLEQAEFQHFRLIVFYDDCVNIDSHLELLWQLTSNTDTVRDIKITKKQMIIDATSKTKKHDNFPRDWPNIVITDDAMIKKVDKNWHDYGFKKFVQSPSHAFRRYVKNNGAKLL